MRIEHSQLSLYRKKESFHVSEKKLWERHNNFSIFNFTFSHPKRAPLIRAKGNPADLLIRYSGLFSSRFYLVFELRNRLFVCLFYLEYLCVRFARQTSAARGSGARWLFNLQKAKLGPCWKAISLWFSTRLSVSRGKAENFAYYIVCVCVRRKRADNEGFPLFRPLFRPPPSMELSGIMLNETVKIFTHIIS